MTWAKKYWDAVRDFYWVPSYIGLKSIPQSKWVKTRDSVTISRSLTNPSGPLYRRLRTWDEFHTYIHRQEETLNHIWNIALGMLPSDVLSELFDPYFGWPRSEDLTQMTGTVPDRYPQIPDANVTTPDSFLTSPTTLIAIELKFNAKTSAAQLAKYAAVLTAEQLEFGRRERLGLLYIYPTHPNRNFERETGCDAGKQSGKNLDRLFSEISNAALHSFKERHRPIIEDTLNRMLVKCISWSQFHAALTSYSLALGTSKGERTLKNVLDGLANEIASHPLSRVRGGQN